MINSQIIYNGKTISFGVAPQSVSVNPVVPRVANTTLTGVLDIVYLPRVDVYISVSYENLCSGTLSKYGIDASALRVQLDNWWQWASRGNQWDYVIDSTKTVRTVLLSAAAMNAGSVDVAAPSAVQVGSKYILIDGPNYQMVTVTNKSIVTVSISPALEYDFAAGTLFRDVYYWSGVIRDDRESPITDAGADRRTDYRVAYFDFKLNFVEVPVTNTATEARGVSIASATVIGVGASV